MGIKYLGDEFSTLNLIKWITRKPTFLYKFLWKMDPIYQRNEIKEMIISIERISDHIYLYLMFLFFLVLNIWCLWMIILLRSTEPTSKWQKIIKLCIILPFKLRTKGFYMFHVIKKLNIFKNLLLLLLKKRLKFFSL